LRSIVISPSRITAAGGAQFRTLASRRPPEDIVRAVDLGTLALFDALFAPAARHHNPRDSRREARRNTLSREHLRPHIDFLTKLAQASGVETLHRIRVRV